MQRLASVQREPGLVSVMAHATTNRILKTYLKIYHRLRIVSAEHLPRAAPFVVVANHTSHLDALLLATSLPYRMRACTFPVAAGDVFFTSPGRTIASSLFLNALPLHRKKVTAHALADLRQRLATGDCGFVLFPEGTRSRADAMLPFKPGLGMLVANSAVPVVPCFIDGADRALGVGHRLPRPARITIRVGSALRFQNCADNRAGWKEVARQTQQAVEALAR